MEDVPGNDGGSRRVGFALLPKKVSRYMTPEIQAAALAQGIEMCLIDYTKPLLEQGPFDVIIHKLTPNEDWESDLQAYSKTHPEVRVIDSVDRITTLRSRITMLSALREEDILLQEPGSSGRILRVKAPPQVVIPDDMPPSEAKQLMLDSGMQPPLIVKPVWTDGREGSHGLAVVHDMQSLSNLLQGSAESSVKPPVVIQEFVEHGAVLFKVYVVGNYTAVCKRPSLGDNYLGHANGTRREGILQLPRISCKSVGSCLSAAGDTLQSSDSIASLPALLDQGGAGELPDTNSTSTSDLPPEWFTHSLANQLRKRLGMQLFNFDLLHVGHEDGSEHQSSSGDDLYYVIDINYFPGVDKIPMFEERFVQFLLSACAVGQQSDAEGSFASRFGE